MKRTRASFIMGAVLAFGLLSVPVRVQAQATPPADDAEYVIGNEDVLQISVWSRSDLDRAVTVNARGNIVFPPVGEVRAAGATARQLADRVGERLSTYLRQSTSVTITVTQPLSRSVWVTGAVANPGRQGYEVIPGLLEVISRAGGAATNADLSRVKVIRRTGPDRGEFAADLDGAMRAGTEGALPPLMPGDVIVVPVLGMASGSIGNDAVGVIGQVNQPGIYPVGLGGELWMLLALAGGPTAQANLGNVRVLTRDGQSAHAVRVDLRETLRLGNHTPYVVKPGDLVFVDSKGPSAWGAFTSMLGVTRDVASIVAVIQVLKNEK